MMGYATSTQDDYDEMFADDDEFMEMYITELQEITLLGNGNGRMIKVNEQIKHLKIENKELNNRLNFIEEMLKKFGSIVSPDMLKEFDNYEPTDAYKDEADNIFED